MKNWQLKTNLVELYFAQGIFPGVLHRQPNDHSDGNNSRNGRTKKTVCTQSGAVEIEVSPALISNVTSAVLEDVRAWQDRGLESVYPIVYFDALFVKSHQDGPVKNKAVYLALSRIAKKWTMPIANWKAALNQFVIMFEDRVIL